MFPFQLSKRQLLNQGRVELVGLVVLVVLVVEDAEADVVRKRAVEDVEIAEVVEVVAVVRQKAVEAAVEHVELKKVKLSSVEIGYFDGSPKIQGEDERKAGQYICRQNGRNPITHGKSQALPRGKR